MRVLRVHEGLDAPVERDAGAPVDAGVTGAHDVQLPQAGEAGGEPVERHNLGPRRGPAVEEEHLEGVERALEERAVRADEVVHLVPVDDGREGERGQPRLQIVQRGDRPADVRGHGEVLEGGEAGDGLEERVSGRRARGAHRVVDDEEGREGEGGRREEVREGAPPGMDRLFCTVLERVPGRRREGELECAEEAETPPTFGEHAVHEGDDVLPVVEPHAVPDEMPGPGLVQSAAGGHQGRYDGGVVGDGHDVDEDIKV